MGEKVKRAGLYLRVSTDDQNTQLQRDEGSRLIENRAWQLAGIYEDVGVSGSKDRRPGLDALLKDARRRKFDVLVVWRADRLFRSVHHMVTTINDLNALGIDFVSCTEPFDTSTPTGRLLMHVCAAFGQFERDVIVERTVAGMAAAKRRGTRIGQPKRRVDLDAVRAMLAEGKSLTCIARELRMGFDTPRKALDTAPLKGSSAEPSAAA
jgi:DNA invertase Pin-like site-specific DNA recombinase